MVTDLQKASMWKRISAYLFDAICLCIIVAGVAWVMSSAFGYDSYNDVMTERQSFYEEKYGTNFTMSQEEYMAMTEEEQKNFQDANDAFLQDEQAIEAYSMIVHLILLTATLSSLIGVLAVEFFMPLMLKNGQTLGKKIFGLGVMRKDGLRVNFLVMFIRTILGKYTIELMLPVLLTILSMFGTLGMSGTTIVSVLLIAQIGVVFATQNHLALHDLMARTVVIDMESQRIFDSEEDKLAYIQKCEQEDNRPDLY